MTNVRWSPRTHSCSTNGPLPTGFVSVASCLRTSLPWNTCAGRIGAFCSHASEKRNGPNGFESLMTAVSGSGVSIVWMKLPGALNFGPYFAETWVSENLTSSEVTGLPSVKFAFSRWKV